jgi:hypothetical protein
MSVTASTRDGARRQDESKATAAKVGPTSPNLRQNTMPWAFLKKRLVLITCVACTYAGYGLSVMQRYSCNDIMDRADWIRYRGLCEPADRDFSQDCHLTAL